MQNYEENLAARVNGQLQPLLGVSITVKDSNGITASLYSDDGVTPLSQPLVTDANGYFGFYAANGRYTLTFAGSQIGTKTRSIELYDKDDAPPLTQAQAAAPTGSSLVGNGGETVAQALDALQLADYTALRAYAGPRKSAYITGYLASAAPSPFAGMFIRDDSDTTTADNGGTVIVASNGRRWKRAYSGSVDVAWFGADPTGANNSAAAIQAARDYCYAAGKSLQAIGSFKLTTTINLRFVRFDFSNAFLNIAHSGIGVYVGGNASNPDNPAQHLGEVTRSVGSDSYSTPSVRCVGAKCQHITVEYCGYFQCYADTKTGPWSAYDYAVAYSTFVLKNCATVELTTNNATDGSATQWINENFFHLNSTAKLLVNGTYGHNHNHFIGGCFEGPTAEINMQTGRSNYVHNIRNEGNLTVTFGTEATDCMVTIGWVSSGHRYSSDTSLTVVNNGKMCAVQHDYDLYAPLIPLAAFDYQSIKKVGSNYSVIGAGNITINPTNLTIAAWDFFYDSVLIPVPGENAVFEAELFNVASGGMRIAVTGYDASKVAITPAANQVSFDGSGTKQFDELNVGINTSVSARFNVLDPNCKYIKIHVRAGGSGAVFDGFYLGARVADQSVKKKLIAATFTMNNMA